MSICYARQELECRIPSHVQQSQPQVAITRRKSQKGLAPVALALPLLKALACIRSQLRFSMLSFNKSMTLYCPCAPVPNINNSAALQLNNSAALRLSSSPAQKFSGSAAHQLVSSPTQQHKGSPALQVKGSPG